MSDPERPEVHDADPGHGGLLDDVAPASADAASTRAGGGRRRGRKRRSGCLPMLLVLALVAAGGYFLVSTIDLKNPFASDDAADFAGPGSGEVVFTVSEGDSLTAMGGNLQELGVVASSEAFVDAAEAGGGTGIGVGVYGLKKQMKAATVVEQLLDGRTKGASYTFTSGKTTEEILDLLAEDTGIARADYDAALADRAAIGLPESADDNAEGYLSPGSYTFFPEDDATAILSQMVTRTRETLSEVDVAAAAERLDSSVHDLVTVASLVETEGSLLSEEGKARIARVIYNRLDDPTGPTIGRLQLDATVNYARGEKVARPTQAQIDEVADSPYNTYTQPGLPPGPIATPSRAALQAAAEPAEGDWLYYVTVDLGTGETKFTGDYDEFLQFKAELDAYCETSERC